RSGGTPPPPPASTGKREGEGGVHRRRERGEPLAFQPVPQALRQPGRRGLALDQVVEGSQRHPAFDQLLFVPVRQDDDRDGGGRLVGAKFLQDRQAVQFRKPYVQKDDVGVRGPCFLQ